MKLKAPFGIAAFAFITFLLAPTPTLGQGAPAQRSGAATVAVNTVLPARPTADQVLAEINLARANPAAYADYLVAMRPAFKGSVYSEAGHPAIATNEGVAAVDEAIAYLRGQRPVPAVQMAKGMCHSASDHVLDVVNNDQMSHRGTDGSMPEDRIGRYGTVTGNGQIAENIAYDAYSARDVVIGFIIDDGFARRSHRLNIFSTDFTVIGVGVEGKASTTSCVVTFAAGYAEKGAATAKPTATAGLAPRKL
jgi:uncharacterized protein YkwD